LCLNVGNSSDGSLQHSQWRNEIASILIHFILLDEEMLCCDHTTILVFHHLCSPVDSNLYWGFVLDSSHRCPSATTSIQGRRGGTLCSKLMSTCSDGGSDILTLTNANNEKQIKLNALLR
jgi:hypothetical protein